MKRNMALIAAFFVVSTMTFAQVSGSTRLLKTRSAEFEQEVVKVTDDVYTAVGYSIQSASMTIDEDGINSVDRGLDTVSAEKVLAEFRKITDKPIKGNAFFVMGRSIGFIGHILDEKRLNMPLYGRPFEDILYDVPQPADET